MFDDLCRCLGAIKYDTGEYRACAQRDRCLRYTIMEIDAQDEQSSKMRVYTQCMRTSNLIACDFFVPVRQEKTRN